MSTMTGRLKERVEVLQHSGTNKAAGCAAAAAAAAKEKREGTHTVARDVVTEGVALRGEGRRGHVLF